MNNISLQQVIFAVYLVVIISFNILVVVIPLTLILKSIRSKKTLFQLYKYTNKKCLEFKDEFGVSLENLHILISTRGLFIGIHMRPCLYKYEVKIHLFKTKLVKYNMISDSLKPIIESPDEFKFLERNKNEEVTIEGVMEDIDYIFFILKRSKGVTTEDGS